MKKTAQSNQNETQKYSYHFGFPVFSGWVTPRRLFHLKKKKKHIEICAVAFLFFLKERQTWKGLNQRHIIIQETLQEITTCITNTLSFMQTI